jgi:hypothetical protein
MLVSDSKDQQVQSRIPCEIQHFL